MFGGGGRGVDALPARRARRFCAREGARASPCQAAWRAEQRGLPRPRAADAIARAVKSYDQDLILLAPALSALAEAGMRENLERRVGNLRRPRLRGRRPAHAAREARRGAARARTMPRPCRGHARGRRRRHARSEKSCPRPIHSICVHGDGPEAVATRAALDARLADAFTFCAASRRCLRDRVACILQVRRSRAKFVFAQSPANAMTFAENRAPSGSAGQDLAQADAARRAWASARPDADRDANAILHAQNARRLALADRAAPQS